MARSLLLMLVVIYDEDGQNGSGQARAYFI